LRPAGLPEDTMIYIKVQYDARNRTFRLVDQEYRTILEGDALYDLAIPLDEESAEELMAVGNMAIAQA
jgi:hypothetical protein